VTKEGDSTAKNRKRYGEGGKPVGSNLVHKLEGGGGTELVSGMVHDRKLCAEEPVNG